MSGRIFWAIALCILLVQGSNAVKLNNVVVLVGDDLSPYNLDPKHPAKMPHWDRLAQRGTKFANAHSSFPVCGPSRMSFMTGRYADSTKLFHFERYAFQVPGLTTMAEYLARQFGYETVAFGKIFHEDHDQNDPITHAMFDSGFWTMRQRGGGSGDGACHGQWYCETKETDNGDWVLSRAFVSFLKSRNTSRPLLAFMGLRKPHLDVAVPSKYVKPDLTDIESLDIDGPPSLGLNNSLVPFKQSLQRFECYYEIARRRAGGQRAFPAAKFLTGKNRGILADMRRHYFAAMAFHDDLIGYVMDYIDSDARYAETTAFIHFADHGFATGEHGMFCKNALFEQQTRVPLIVAPARRDTGVDRGRTSIDPVDLVDIFPTIVDLATGQSLGRQAKVDNSGIPIDGRSLVSSRRSLYAFSQYPRCDKVSQKANWQCVIATTPCGRLPNIFMGYTVRILNQKYVEWRPFNDVFTGCSRPTWPGMSKIDFQRLRPVRQMDVNRTGTVWSKLPVQRELFQDYQDDDSNGQWGQWERSNALVDNLHDQSRIITALELSAAIRWRFDPSFARNSPEQPCSGNGYVRLSNKGLWASFDRQPERSDVECQCIGAWSGDECQRLTPP
jgi:iduronate 2-sulfatase